MVRRAVPFLVFAVLLALAPSAGAHVPDEPVGNESLDSAYPVDDPTKSWVLYGALRAGFPQYYTFEFAEGEPIYLGLIVPIPEARQGFVASLALMGPGLPQAAEVPEGLEVPAASGLLVLEGRLPEAAAFEPFTPGSFYELGTMRLEAPASGTYHAAVFSATSSGSYGLVLGVRESFTLEEWITTPLDLLFIYQWEGQPLVLILAPWAAILVGGMALVVRRQRARGLWGTPFLWLTTAASLLFLGTGASVLVQLGIAVSQSAVVPTVAVTAILAAVPLLLGTLLLRLAFKAEGRPSRKTRIKVAVLGLLGLFGWAGLIVGPALALAASLTPQPRGPRVRTGPEDVRQ